MTTLKEHLNKARKKAHETMIANGHYFRMSEAGRKGREQYWKNKAKNKDKKAVDK